MEETWLICEDSLEGILTGIYDAYALRKDHRYIHIQVGEEDNLRLFARYVKTAPDAGKAVKVSRTVCRELGADVWLDICQALATEEADKGEAVYRTIVCGLRMKDRKAVMGNLADPYVHRVFTLSRNAANEIHHWKEFLRFQELSGGVLFSKIGPKNNIVTFLAPHFADRLPLFNFIICDEKRGIFVTHPASGQWYVVTDPELNTDMTGSYSPEEEDYQKLFTYFCRKIAVEERKNVKLQRNMLPLWFQEYMVEFREK